MTSTPSEGRSPWLVGIIVAFAVVVAINVAFIVIAVRDSDPVVPSYSQESR